MFSPYFAVNSVSVNCGTGIYPPPLPPDQTYSPDECPFCSNNEVANFIGGPINTSTGNYNYETTDLSLPSVGQPLRFERTYNSIPVTGTVVYSQPLGYGWTHNYDLNLTFPGDPGGEPGTVILKAPHGSRLRFTEVSTGTYEPYPGVWANMVRQGIMPPYNYVITAANQTAYTFNGFATSYNITFTNKLTASDGFAEDYFAEGDNVALSGNTAIVGAWASDAADYDAGAAYIFVRNGTTWSQQDELLANDGELGDMLGDSVAIDNDTTVVGAPGKDSAQGAAYVFVRNGTGWSQQGNKLVASDGTSSDFFGASVAISGDTAIVGAPAYDFGAGFGPGAAYIFVRNGPTWSQQDILTATAGAIDDGFGSSVALSGDTAIIGAPGQDGQGTNAGAAYVFVRNGTEWSQQDVLTGSVGAAGDGFGRNVALSGDTALVGAEGHDDSGANTGAAYIFVRNGTEWSQQSILLAGDRAAGDGFGGSVALSGSTALIGAASDDDQGSASGSAYLFRGVGASWTQQAKLLANEGAADDQFGGSVAISSQNILVGAWGDDDNGERSGSAYLFEYEPQEGTYLVAIRDPQGNRTVFTYTSGISLTRVADERSGRYLDFGYDSSGRVITTTDSASRSVTYGYNANGDLTTVRDARGFTWTYTYSGTTHLLYEVKDPENKVLERTSYSLVGDEYKATLQQDGENRTLAQIDYLSGGQRRVTEAGKVVTDTYDSRNLLVSQTDAQNRTQNYTLDGSFNRTGVADIRNQTTVYSRTALGLTTAITNSLTQTTRFQYNGNHNLSAVIENDSTQTNYVYDTGNNLRQIGTVSGTTYFDYNSFGQVISTTDRLAHTTRYGYDLIGNLTVITDAKGQTTSFTYDPQGRVETVTNARGMVTRYRYDAGDLVRYVTENYTTTFCLATECNMITEFQYDNAGRLVWTVDPVYRKTKREYDNGGRLSKIILNYQDGVFSNSAPDEDLSIRYVYDTSGRLQSTFETLAAGTQAERETRITYDSLSRVSSVSFNYNGGSAQLTTSYAYQDNTVPAIVDVTDPTGVVTRYEYDALGRLSRRIDNYRTTACPASECNLATRYEYDGVGNLKRMYDPANLRTEYDYDPLHRLTGVTENYSGSGSYGGIMDQNIKTGYQYDNEGNLTRVNPPLNTYTIFRYDELNRLDQMENALGHLWDYAYDPASNLSQIVNPKSQIVNYQYDLVNRLTTIDYPNPETDVSFGYDALNRRTAMSDTSGNSSYSYDDLDRLLGVTDGRSQAVAYRYDARGNRTRLTYPDGKTVTYGYDTADRLFSVRPDWDTGSYTYTYTTTRLISTTNPAGIVTTYSYDGANRLSGLTHLASSPPASSPLAVYSYTLDALGNVRTVTETQALVLPAGTYQESGGQVVMESEKYGQVSSGASHQWLTATVQSGYTGTAYLQPTPDIDQLYQTSQITNSPKAEFPIQFTTPGTYTVWLRGYPANAAGDSVYVGLKNQIVGVTGFAPGQWSWARVNLSSSLAATLPLTTTGLYTLGLWMREDGLRIDRLLLTTNTTFIPTGFGPTESTRLANQTTLSTTITRTIVYTYDNLYRLTNANYSTGELFAYTYDPAGNRKTQTTLAGTNVYTYDGANRLTQVDGQSYSWDNNGNLLNDGVRSYVYDSANRLTSVTQGGTTTQFTYNGNGDRMAQIVGGVSTNYVLDPTGLAQVLMASIAGQSQYYLPGLAQYDTAWAYYLPDRLGSLRQLANNTGQVNLAQSYDPFGNVLQQTGSGQSIFGYTGEQIDPTGLVYLRARYYNPGTGRFLTADSIIPNPLNSMGWNRYAYVGNNPVNQTDPSGHCIIVVVGDTLVCAAIVIGGIALVAYGVAVLTSPQYQQSWNRAMRSLPGYGMWSPDTHRPPTTTSPVFRTDETFDQCYQPGPNIGRPNPWQLPPLSMPSPYFGPTTPPFSANPVPIPNISTSRSRANDLPRTGNRVYVPPKQKGNPSTVYNQQQGGFVDADGNVWVWDLSGHGGPHWDVQHRNGSHTNVSPEGNVIGKDNFPNRSR